MAPAGVSCGRSPERVASVASTPGHCEFRFHGALNAFLAPALRDRGFTHVFDGTPAVKDRIESLGVPHTEVGRILVDGEAVPFARRVRGGERVEVHPDAAGPATALLRPALPMPPRFVLDVHLGRLAGYLRLLGFDTLYRNDYRDGELIALSRLAGRVALSRDTGLLKRAELVHGAFVHATDPRRQLREVVDRFGLAGWIRPFARCARCNGLVVPLARADQANGVPADMAARGAALSHCSGCGQVYCQGSHQARLRQRLAEVGVSI